MTINETQKEYGDKMFKSLREAASKNKVFNLSSKENIIFDNVGPMLVGIIEDNGGLYTLVVGIKDDRSVAHCGVGPHRGYPILQVDINKEEISVLRGVYKPTERYSIGSTGEFDQVIRRFVDYVENYRLFK